MLDLFDEDLGGRMLYSCDLDAYPFTFEVTDQLDIVTITREDDDGIDLLRDLRGHDGQGYICGLVAWDDRSMKILKQAICQLTRDVLPFSEVNQSLQPPPLQ